MEQIKCLRDIKNAADNKRSLTSVNMMFSRHPIPAAVVINFSGQLLLRLIDDAGLYIYEKKDKNGL